MKSPNFEKITEEQNKLREERNKLSKEMCDIQSQIDKLEIEKYCVDVYIGKIVKFCYDDVTTFIRVEKIERNMRTPRFCGTVYHFYDDDSMEINKGDFFGYYQWNEFEDNVVVTDEDELKKYLSKCCK